MSKASQIRQKAQNLLKKGHYEKAIDEYKRLVSIESRNPNLYNELGDIYLKAGNKVAAVSSFDKASKNYESVALYNNAVAVCKKILRVVPQHLETMYKLGELRIKQHLEGEGINYFSQLLDLLLGDPERGVSDLNAKLEHMLELVPANEDVASKVAIIFERMGLKVKAMEILLRLCSGLREGGDLDRLEVYEGRIAALRSDLTPAEAAEVEQIFSEEEHAGMADVEPSAAQAPLEPSEPAAVESGGGHEQVPAGEEEAAGGGKEAPAQEFVIDDEATPSVEEVIAASEEAAVEEPAVAVETGDAASRGGGYDDAAVPPGAARPAEAGDAKTAPAGIEEGPPSGPDDTVDEQSISGKLADEITSDVEKDDHQGHYDLGMAYLEMALYTEAIKEFQCAARSQQLQMKSYEMIGNCFLQQNNPRLAVKQLLRGLEVAKTGGGDTLGIHYNLGLAFEMLGEDEKAREHFEEVYVVDITFRDVEEKMEKYNSLS